MSATSQSPARVESPVTRAPMVHRYCGCDDSVGLCGKRLTGAFRPGAPIECVVCAALRDAPCPRCDARWAGWKAVDRLVDAYVGFWRAVIG